MTKKTKGEEIKEKFKNMTPLEKSIDKEKYMYKKRPRRGLS